MKKTKQIIVAAIALAFAAIIPTASAQREPVYQSQTLGTVRIAGSTATNVNYVLDVRKQKDVFVQIQNNLDGAGTDAISIGFTRSVDGLVYNTVPLSIAVAPNGTALTTVFTNIATHGAAYIKINYVTNAAASNVSTNTIKYGIKIQAP